MDSNKDRMTVKNVQRLQDLDKKLAEASNEYYRVKSEMDKLVSETYSGKLKNARTIARNLYDKHFLNFFSFGKFCSIVPFADRSYTLESAFMSNLFIFTASDHEIASWVRDKAYSRILDNKRSDSDYLKKRINVKKDTISDIEVEIELLEKDLSYSQNQSSRIEEILVRNREKSLERKVAKKTT